MKQGNNNFLLFDINKTFNLVLLDDEVAVVYWVGNF